MNRNMKIEIPSVIRWFFLAWIIAVMIEYLLLPNKYRQLESLDALSQMSLMRVFITILFIMLLLCFVSWRYNLEKVERWMIVGAFVGLSILSLSESFSWNFLGACVLILAILLVYGKWGWNHTKLNVSVKKLEQKEWRKKDKSKVFLLLVIGLSILFFLLVSAWTVCRVYNFSTPTFDMGIFSQMFYYMKTTGIPSTTVERDGLLSHFHVHMSPIYYILLPFYCLVPTPATLQVLQAVVITSAVIPLWKIAKVHGLSAMQRMFFCAVLFLYPAFAGSTGYDIHENCFLTPLLLWLFYGIDRKNVWMITSSSILIFMVKEDAPIYVAVIGLWLLVTSLLHHEKWGIKTGAILLLSAVGYFFTVITYLTNFGDGILMNRYKNFLYDDSSSLISIIKVVFLFPMKVVYECADTGKIQYIALTMLPLLGLPIFTRRFERYILLIPYILVNLMPDYVYQHDIYFQYSFGVTACFLYITIIHLADNHREFETNTMLVAMVGMSMLCFCSTVVPKASTYISKQIRQQEYYEEIRTVLDEIPEDASVTASTFYTTYLSQRAILYDIGYATKEHLLSTEYVVLNLSGSFKKYATNGKNGYENLIQLLEKNGYKIVTKMEGELVIYSKS